MLPLNLDTTSVSLIEDCVAVAGVEELYIFELWLWLNKLVVLQTRSRDIPCTISLFVPSQTTRNRSLSTTQNSLYLSSQPKAALLPSSAVLFYTFFPNTHWQYAPAWLKVKIFGQGGAECTGGDGRVRCIYLTRHGVRQNDRFITIILFSWSREAKIEIESEIQLIAQPYTTPVHRNRLLH